MNGQTLDIDINDSFDLQVKDSSAAYVSLFGGEITDVIIAVGATGSKATVVEYTVIAMGSLARLTKEIWDNNISQDEDGDQIYGILSSVLLGTNYSQRPGLVSMAHSASTENHLGSGSATVG